MIPHAHTDVPWPRHRTARLPCPRIPWPRRQLATAAWALLGLMAGCSDDAPGDNDAGRADAAPCHPSDATAMPHGRALVATEQYGSGGGVTVIDLDTLEPRINVALTSDDVTLRWFDGRVWVLNRYGADNLMVLDGASLQLQDQFSIRPSASLACNPHDVLFLSTCRAYLTCFAQATLYAVDPTAPLAERISAAVDLSPLADADGLPEASHMALVGDRVYVAVERLARADGWGPVAPSSLAVVDPARDTLEDTIPLSLLNPVGPLQPVPGTTDLLATCGGAWDGTEAGFDRVDTVTGTATTVVTAEDLGGVPTAATLGSDLCGFAVITSPGSYETGVVRYCLDGTVTPCIPVGELEVSDVAQVDDGRLLVTDRAVDAPGVRVFDPDTCQEDTVAPIATGFAPGFTNPLLLIPSTEDLH